MECLHPMLVTALYLSIIFIVAFSATDPNDYEVMDKFRAGLENPEVLKWPASGGDPCGPPSWKHVFCTGTRVSQIQVQGLNLKGSLPQNLNKLSMLTDLGLQKNQFSGQLPSFNGLSNLRHAYLDYNVFDSIPPDFFYGLDNLQTLALDYNNYNASSGWMFPRDLLNSAQIINLSCMSCNLVGPLPDFIGKLSSLQFLKLSGNSLSGEIPSSLNGAALQILWLNNQKGSGMTGTIDVVATMVSLSSLWLHGNQFTGRIPDAIGNLSLLKDLNLNGNQLVGLIPGSLASLELDMLDLNNNHFMGPIPKFKAAKATFTSNAFCQSIAGTPCNPEVMALIEFLSGLNYPSRLVSSWSGNDPCSGPWLGVNCNSNQKVFRVSLSKFNLSGALSPSVANLDSVSEIRLASNNLSGPIPGNWTSLKSLTLLDLSGNNFSPPLPKFSSSIKLIIDGNPLFSNNRSVAPPGSSPTSGGQESPTNSPSPVTGMKSNSSDTFVEPAKSKSSKRIVLLVIIAIATCALLIVTLLSIYCCLKRRKTSSAPSSLVIHPRDLSDPNNMVKIVVADNNGGSTSMTTKSGGSASRDGSRIGDSHLIETGNLVIAVQVLRNVTKNFSQENVLGRGGFGVVYKGDLEDGTHIAVKRMEASVVNNKALDEFQSEIEVLSKVRHRNLVSLLGYSIEGNERILVYEYMPQGALSRHLFHWKSLKLEPLSWKRRLNIALDVARGVEYLHTLAHRSFIHRDLKPSNILLGDDFRAKVSDFGLVKLAPDGKKSVVTKLAGTFGYLAPEYAVTGKITTKADVFSFGVVLMELLTGLMSLDDDRPEESQYMPSWFSRIRLDKEKLRAAIDPTLDVKEETYESIITIAELAGHCTAREPGQRPDMGHAVNVLGSLVEKWKPLDDDPEEYSGINYSLPLDQMVNYWKESEGMDFSYLDLEDSKGSIPARPNGFADSFTSVDGR